MCLNRLRSVVLILGCIFIFNPIPCWSDNLRLLVVLSYNLPAYQSFANTLKTNLPESVQVTVLEHPEKLSDQPPADLIISVGMKASLSAVSQTKVPLLVVMIPKESYEQLLAQSTKRYRAPLISAIYLDQPWKRQLNFIRAILPEYRRIGLLYSVQTLTDLTLLRKQVAKRDVRLTAKLVSSEDMLFSTLDDVLNNSDILLSLPDTMIYNSTSIRNILLSCYRSAIPFIGLSQAYVNAGAIGAIFSSQQQLSEQATEAIHLFLQNGNLPKPEYSHDFTISLNSEVARSLDIQLPSPEIVRSIMSSVDRSIP